jgi:hypothetical protein
MTGKTTTPATATTASPSPVPYVTPDVTIISPTIGKIISGDKIEVSVKVNNFDLVDITGNVTDSGKGHIAYYLDSEVSKTSFEPVKTGNGVFVSTTATSYTWQNVKPGIHNITVQLLNIDNSPVIPVVYFSINVEVR